jgi:hypothetical protein
LNIEKVKEDTKNYHNITVIIFYFKRNRSALVMVIESFLLAHDCCRIKEELHAPDLAKSIDELTRRQFWFFQSFMSIVSEKAFLILQILNKFFKNCHSRKNEYNTRNG